MIRKLESSEHQIQCAIVKWCKLNKILIVNVRNEGKRSAAGGMQAKLAGLSPGFPDLIIPMARRGFHGLMIELKRAGNMLIRENQDWWQKTLVSEGYSAHRCQGLDETLKIIKWYFDIKEK